VIIWLPAPAVVGSKVPNTPLVIPLPVHVPPPWAAAKFVEDASTQNGPACVIVASQPTALLVNVTSSIATEGSEATPSPLLTHKNPICTFGLLSADAGKAIVATAKATKKAVVATGKFTKKVIIKTAKVTKKVAKTTVKVVKKTGEVALKTTLVVIGSPVLIGQGIYKGIKGLSKNSRNKRFFKYAKKGDIKKMKKALAKGKVKIAQLNKQEQTALMIAIANLKFGMVKYLLSQMNDEQINLNDIEGKTAYDYAVDTNNEEMIDLISNSKDFDLDVAI